MKTFDQIREELNQLDEGYESNKIRQSAMKSLSHGTGEKHTGHDGMASYHASMANKYKGTEAGKHHQRASDHHMRALRATQKGNLKSGLTHAKNALDAAKAAHDSHNSRHSEAGKSDSMSLYHDHKGAVTSQRSAQNRDDAYNQRRKPKRSDKPVQRAIGKAKSKIKKVLRMGEVDLKEKKYSWGAPESVILDKVQKMIANTKNAPEAYKLVANKMKVTDAMAKKLVNKVIDRSINKGKR